MVEGGFGPVLDELQLATRCDLNKAEMQRDVLFEELKQVPAVSSLTIKEAAIQTFHDTMAESLLIFISFLFLGADFGDVPLAANQILLQFLHITAYAMDGFAFAAEAMVGQALGARNRAALRRSALVKI